MTCFRRSGISDQNFPQDYRDPYRSRLRAMSISVLIIGGCSALEEQRNGEWRYLEFLQVTSLITAEIFMRGIPRGMRARQRSGPVDLPEHRY